MANNYTLELHFEKGDLKQLKPGGFNITIAKPVSGEEIPSVAWLVIDPFEDNEIQWTENYGLYATHQEFKNGAVIKKSSGEPSPKDNKYYHFHEGQFDGPYVTELPLPGLGSYGVLNQMPASSYPYLLFGLEQTAICNNRPISSPINAAIVNAGYKAIFTPLTTIYVWMQSLHVSGTVITNVISNYSIITFGGTTTNVKLKYDSDQAQFVPVNSLDSGVCVPMKREGVY